MKGLYCRRCRAQQKHAITLLHSLPRNFTCVIARRLILFVGRILFFIDNDETQVLQWGKNRRARADHYLGPAFANAVPLVKPFSGRHAAMEKRHLVRKPRHNQPAEKRRQPYFRHQEKGGPSQLQHFRDQPEINFGFAASGHSVNQAASRLPLQNHARIPSTSSF